MAKRGRPRSGKELEIVLAERALNREQQLSKIREWQHRQDKDPEKRIKRNRIHAEWRAATFLNTLELGGSVERARAESEVLRLRRKKEGGMPPKRLVENFLKKFAPDWNWRAQKDDGKHERRNERIAAERAEDLRTSNARRLRHVTPTKPSRMDLICLRQTQIEDRTWPTLRTLKFAFAMPEKTITRSINALQPAKSEVSRIRRRRVGQGRGGFPKRYGPRIVLGLLELFVTEWLPGLSSLQSEQKKAFRADAMAAKRAISPRLKRSPRAS